MFFHTRKTAHDGFGHGHSHIRSSPSPVCPEARDKCSSQASRNQISSSWFALENTLPKGLCPSNSTILFAQHLSEGASKMGQVQVICVMLRETLYGIHGIHSHALRNMSPKITNNFAGPSAEHSWGLSPLSPHHHVETHSKLCIFGVCMDANRFTVRESALETRFCPKSITYQGALVPLSVAISACH